RWNTASTSLRRAISPSTASSAGRFPCTSDRSAYFIVCSGSHSQNISTALDTTSGGQRRPQDPLQLLSAPIFDIRAATEYVGFMPLARVTHHHVLHHHGPTGRGGARMRMTR